MTVGHSRTDTGVISGVETYVESHGYDSDKGSLTPAQVFGYRVRD